MTVGAIVVVVILVVLVAVLLLRSVRAVRQDERGVVFRLGRVRPGVREPGLTVVVPFIDRLERVPMTTRVADVPADVVFTRDDVAMRVGAAVHVRVIDPVAATVSVADHLSAVAQLTTTSLRSFIGHCDFDELTRSDHANYPQRASGTTINAQLRELIAEAAEESWGLRIEQIEIVVPEVRSQGSTSTGR